LRLIRTAGQSRKQYPIRYAGIAWGTKMNDEEWEFRLRPGKRTFQNRQREGM
jgi:hypothetical protein